MLPGGESPWGCYYPDIKFEVVVASVIVVVSMCPACASSHPSSSS